MVKHIILWQLKPELNEIEKKGVKEAIKRGLEGLKGKIEGIEEIKVNINPLPSSTCDLMLDSTFKDYASLKAYKDNPFHLEVANGKVRPNVAVRLCLDYEM